MNRKIIVTEDNSKTLLIPSLGETYHSTHGALTESRHIFIKSGLNYFQTKSSIDIFEMGFGSGLNLLTTLIASIEESIQINYLTLEKYPITSAEHALLKHESLTQNETVKVYFQKAILSPWNQTITLNKQFYLKKMEGDIEDYTLKASSIDLIYFDAFAPKIQPNLWTLAVMQKMHHALRPGGVFITYCAQGQLKRNLKAAGFQVEALPGPPGKREITRAIKKN